MHTNETIQLIAQESTAPPSMTSGSTEPATPSGFGEKTRAGVDFYQVNELFRSVQGEGVLTGIDSTFVRLQGCTVGCPWCDSGPLADRVLGRMTNGQTRNTWGRGGSRMTPDEIVARCETTHVIITGGEPTLWNLDELIVRLRRNGHRIQLETSGQNDLKGQLVPDWITVSPKQMLDWKIAGSLFRRMHEVKWVVEPDTPPALVRDTWQRIVHDFGDGRRLTLPYFTFMPEGSPPTPDTIAMAMAFVADAPAGHSWHWRFTDRMQYRLSIR